MARLDAMLSNLCFSAVVICMLRGCQLLCSRWFVVGPHALFTTPQLSAP